MYVDRYERLNNYIKLYNQMQGVSLKKSQVRNLGNMGQGQSWAYLAFLKKVISLAINASTGTLRKKCITR